MARSESDDKTTGKFYPVPLDPKAEVEVGREEGENVFGTLLPYLLMGFLPTHQGDAGSQSGLYALMTSFNAARRALQMIDEDEDDDSSESGDQVNMDTNISQWQKWFESTTYKDILSEFLDRHPHYGQLLKGKKSTGAMRADKQRWQEAIAKFSTRKQDLEQEHMIVLVEVANRIYGMFLLSLHQLSSRTKYGLTSTTDTKFELGIIKQGHAYNEEEQTTSTLVMHNPEECDRPVVVRKPFSAPHSLILTNRVVGFRKPY